MARSYWAVLHAKHSIDSGLEQNNVLFNVSLCTMYNWTELSIIASYDNMEAIDGEN